MASNGGEASSPPTEPAKMEQAVTKSGSAPASDLKSEKPAAPVKQVPEDLSTNNKIPEEKEISTPVAKLPDAPKPEANNTHEVTSSTAEATKANKEATEETKMETTPAPSEVSPAASKSVTNGTDKQQSAASSAPAVQTKSTTEESATPAPTEPKTKTETPAEKTPAPAASTDKVSEDATKAEGEVTEQKASVDQANKTASTPSKPELPSQEPVIKATTQETAKSEAPTQESTNNELNSQKATKSEAPSQEPIKNEKTSPEATKSEASSHESTKPVTPSQESDKAAAPSQESSKPVAPSEETDKATAAPVAVSKPATQQTKAVPPVATVAPMPKVSASKTKPLSGTKHAADTRPAGEAPPEKKAKLATPSSSASGKSGGSSSASNVTPAGGKTPQQILDYMDKTFEARRRTITKQMPTIPELQKLYPDLFMHKQLLTEFQRITKIDIDQKIQEFCVRFATAVIEMARGKKGAAPVLARWEKAQQENHSLKQYWDMMTALCLLPLHFGENFADMVQEIGENEEVEPQGKIVPVLVARGNVYRTDEFFLIAENTIVQEFEEFTIALASLYSSYWVFNMVYPESIENTYNYIQRCIVRQKEPGSIPTVCRNFTKALQKWNREKEGK